MKSSFSYQQKYLIILLLLALHEVFSGKEKVEFTVQKGSPDFTAVAMGQPLQLNVIFNGTEDGLPILVFIEWNFRPLFSRLRKRVLSMTWDRGHVVTDLYNDKRASALDSASLLLVNTSLNDSGTYSCNVFSLPSSRRHPVLYFNVTVEGKPKADITCAEKINVTWGGNVTCRCNAHSVYFTPLASWFKNGQVQKYQTNSSQELSLHNVGKDAAGTYVCRARLYSMVDEKATDITVHYPPRITSFRGVLSVQDDSITLTCLAEGSPKPSYTIKYFSGPKIAESLDGIVVTNISSSVNVSYICIAKNILGQDKSRLNGYIIISKADTPQKEDDSLIKGTEWYIILVSVIVGVVFGFGLLKCIQRLRHRKNVTIRAPPLRPRPESDIPVYVDPASFPMSQCWKEHRGEIPIYDDPTVTPPISRPDSGHLNDLPIYVDPMTIPAIRQVKEKTAGTQVCCNSGTTPPQEALPYYQELEDDRQSVDHIYQSLRVPEIKES